MQENATLCRKHRQFLWRTLTGIWNSVCSIFQMKVVVSVDMEQFGPKFSHSKLRRGVYLLFGATSTFYAFSLYSMLKGDPTMRIRFLSSDEKPKQFIIKTFYTVSPILSGIDFEKEDEMKLHSLEREWRNIRCLVEKELFYSWLLLQMREPLPCLKLVNWDVINQKFCESLLLCSTVLCSTLLLHLF